MATLCQIGKTASPTQEFVPPLDASPQGKGEDARFSVRRSIHSFIYELKEIYLMFNLGSSEFALTARVVHVDETEE
jgi:hypothetical protein